MFDNLTPDEATVAYIIQAKQSFDDAITQHEIADEFIIRRRKNICNRKVRIIIEYLITKGYPIISTSHNEKYKCGGYCWGGNRGEAKECYKQLRRRGIRILLRARRVLRNSRNEARLF